MAEAGKSSPGQHATHEQLNNMKCPELSPLLQFRQAGQASRDSCHLIITAPAEIRDLQFSQQGTVVSVMHGRLPHGFAEARPQRLATQCSAVLPSCAEQQQQALVEGGCPCLVVVHPPAITQSTPKLRDRLSPSRASCRTCWHNA